MVTESLLANPRLPRWLGGRGRNAADPSVALRKAIEREFLYRGASALEIKSLILYPEERTVYGEFYARPLYQTDDRLKSKPWVQLFAEQTLEDTAKVLRATWAQMPNLEAITLKVLRRPLIPQNAPEDVIVLLHAAGEATKQVVLGWSKTTLVGLLQHCEVHYEFDPRVGLQGLTKDRGQ